MCECCVVCSGRKKRFLLSGLSLIVLSISVLFVIFSTCYDEPWLRLTLKKTTQVSSNELTLNEVPKKLMLAGDPNFSILLPWDDQVIIIEDDDKNEHKPGNNVVNKVTSKQNRKLEETEEDKKPMKRNLIMKVLYSINRLPEILSMYTARQQQDVYLVSVWSLYSVLLSVPEFNYTQKIEIKDLSRDPLLASALSLSGVYQAWTDMLSANRLIKILSLCGIFFLCISVVSAFICFVIDFICLCSKKRSNQRNATAAPAVGGNEDEESMINMPLTTSNVFIPVQHRDYIKRDWLICIGMHSMLGVVCLATAFGVWALRTYIDSKQILQAMGTFMGHRAINWVIQHVSSELEVGCIKYVFSIFLVTVLGLLCLFTDVEEQSPNAAAATTSAAAAVNEAVPGESENLVQQPPPTGEATDQNYYTSLAH